MGTEKRHIPFWRLYLPSNRSICFREKETTQKNRYLLSKRYFFVKFTTGIFPAASPQWGLPSISFCVTPTKDNSALYASRKDCAHSPHALIFNLSTRNSGKDFVRPRLMARVFFPAPFLMDFSRGRGFSKIVFSKMRPSVSPCESRALVSVDFATPKMMDSQKRHFILETVFTSKSVDFVSRKGVDTKNALPLVKVYLFFVKFTAVIFPAALMKVEEVPSGARFFMCCSILVIGVGLFSLKE